jgi:acetoin utilization protein AcuB
MLAKELISASVFPIKITDTCDKALNLMNEFNIGQAPVVDNDTFLGYISTEDLFDVGNKKQKIATLVHNDINIKVKPEQHFFELIRIFEQTDATFLAVIDDEEHYVGVITLKDMVKKLATLSSFKDIGGIITLEIDLKDYSLAEIARLVEYNNAKILSLYINVTPDINKMEVSIKLNKSDLKNIIATFERYNYTIRASYMREEDWTSVKDRYDSFMRYLNM